MKHTFIFGRTFPLKLLDVMFLSCSLYPKGMFLYWETIATTVLILITGNLTISDSICYSFLNRPCLCNQANQLLICSHWVCCRVSLDIASKSLDNN